MEKYMKKLSVFVVAIVMSLILIPTTNTNAAQKPKLNKKSATIYVGKTVKLKVKGNRKKVKWSSSNKKVATVSSKGKVKGKKAGKATITAKVGNKKLKCKVTVKQKSVKKANNKKPVVTYTKTSVKQKIANACKEYGKYSSDSNGSYYYLDAINESTNMCVYTQVKYYPSTDIIRINNLSGYDRSNMTIMVYFDIESVSDSTCSVTFYDGDSQYYGNGIMYKLLMDDESAVIFYDTNMPYTLEDTAEKLTTTSARLALTVFEQIMSSYNVGVTSADLGFY